MARRGRPSKNPNPDDDQTDFHIMVQLRKLVSLGGLLPVEFRNGDKEHISPRHAQLVLWHYDDLKRATEKEALQERVGASYQNFCDVVSVIS